MNAYTLVFPHQMFKVNPAIKRGRKILVLEDPLFFGDLEYPAHFHKHKLVLHRSTLKSYEQQLKDQGHLVHYLEYASVKNGIKDYEKLFREYQISQLHVIDPCDYLLQKRIRKVCEHLEIKLSFYPTPSFYLNQEDIEAYGPQEHYAFTPFYISQRKKLRVLLGADQKPIGNKWTFDTENRKKAPKGFSPPPPPIFKPSAFDQEAKVYVDQHFAKSPGKTETFWFPTNSLDALSQLESFVEYRLADFGPYQDAILKNEQVLLHSLLSSSLNIGLLTPQQIVEKALNYSGIPLGSLEGFIRQVIGWREFIRVVYELDGVKQRTCNYWKHHRKIPASFYEGTTGIEPIDQTIKRAVKTAYCHHIERLMVLGNFMLLCEFDPDEVYRWFMEMFIDSYDWVMVPNVYGMSQYADGGLMTTKPYISSSNYILKMSDYSRGGWCEVWDALFWRFLFKHRDFFDHQPRLGLLSKQLDKMEEKKLKNHLTVAEKFLKSLD